MTHPILDAIRFEEGQGLVPVVAQDAHDGRVLMLGYADRTALEATLATGELHFHSRSRGRLWRKGETSGDVLRVRSLAADCDADAILATVEAAGPTCHTGTRSCFDGTPAAVLGQATTEARRDDSADQGFTWLESLWRTIEDRVRERPPGSYTASLVDGGVDAVARKVAEEATEVVIAAKDHAAAGQAAARPGGSAGAIAPRLREAVAAESADLLYHLLVLLAERGIRPAELIAELRRRHDTEELRARASPP